MNWFSFGMKFGLISVLFFLLLLIISFYLVCDVYCQFSDIWIELQSLMLLGSGFQIWCGLEFFNDLLQINVVIGQFGKVGDLEVCIVDVQKGLCGWFEVLVLFSEDGVVVVEFEVQCDWLFNGLQVVEVEGFLQGKGVWVEKLFGSVQVFIKLFIVQVGFSQDSQCQVCQFSELVGLIMLEVMVVISKGCVIGVYFLGQGFFNLFFSVWFDELLLEFEKLYGEYGLKLQEFLVGSLQLFEEVVQVSCEILKSLGQLFEDWVIVVEMLDILWMQFYDQVSVVMDKIYQFDDVVFGYFDIQL